MRSSDTTSVAAGGAVTRLRSAEGLWRTAMAVLALVPLGMAVANRSSPTFLAVSAACALGAVAVEGRMRAFLHDIYRALASPLGGAVLTFAGWCLVSIAWSEFKLVSLRAYAEFWLSIAAAFVLGLALLPRITGGAFRLLAVAWVLACVMIVAEIESGLVLRQMLGLRAYNFIFNRPVLTLLVLMLPLAALFLARVRHGWAYGLALLSLLAGTVLLSDSDAALLGLIAACLAFPAAWFFPRLARAGLAAVVLVSFLAAPFYGDLGERLLPPSAHEALASGHSRERVELWASFGAVVRNSPLLGTGFGVSPRMHRTTTAQDVPAERRPMLAIGHPHSLALQIWVELGLVGIALALVVIFLTLRAVFRQPHLMESAFLALIAGAAPAAFVGHGAWQGWWAASLGAAVIWMLAIGRIQAEKEI